MPLLLWIWNNKRWTLIIVLLIYAVFQTWQSNSLAGDLSEAKADCKTKVQQEVDKAIKPYKDVEQAVQVRAQKVGDDYEQTKETERVKTETITREVQKIIERPIYLNTCLDDAGVSAVNTAGNTIEPESALP